MHQMYTNWRGDVLSLLLQRGLYAKLTITLKSKAPVVSFYRRYSWGELKLAESDFEALREFGGFIEDAPEVAQAVQSGVTDVEVPSERAA